MCVYIGGQVMATLHNGIIIGSTVYNTILSLKLSYLHVGSIGKGGSTTGGAGGAGGAPSTTRDVMTVLLQVNLFIIAVQE